MSRKDDVRIGRRIANCAALRGLAGIVMEWTRVGNTMGRFLLTS
jgi:hypothetical protein